MSELDRTVKCPHCEKLYKFYAFSAADQSACPACVAEAERSVEKPDTFQQAWKRARRGD